MARRKRFVTWAKEDPQDTTPIVYTFKAKEYASNGIICEKVYRFTSEDTIGFVMMERVRNAWIESITKHSGVWNVTIYED